MEQEILTNSTLGRHTVENLRPYTVYSFRVAAINVVGRSKPSKDSYPAVTLMESKCARGTFSLFGAFFQQYLAL